MEPGVVLWEELGMAGKDWLGRPRLLDSRGLYADYPTDRINMGPDAPFCRSIKLERLAT